MGNRDDQPHPSGTQASAARTGPSATAEQFVLRDLASGFAHELNQPLAAIAAYADGAATLLRRDTSHSTQALNIVEAISAQALRAGNVIEQLRGAARALPPSSVPLDPNALVRNVQPLLESLAAQQRVRLLVELRTPVPPVLGDANRLQALLVLLLGNALDTLARLPVERRKLTIATDDADSSAVELSGTGPTGMLFTLGLPRVEVRRP